MTLVVLDSPAAADDPVVVYFRVEGPANQSAYPATGEYETIFAGYINVPAQVNVTCTSGITYHLYVNSSDRYVAERTSDGQTWDRGAGNQSLGATSVIAALEQARQQGNFSYNASDSYFPGMGFLINSIGDYTGSGAVGWNYRVWNTSDAYSPSTSCDGFLLGYDTMPLDLPHQQVLWYWGGPSGTYPLKVSTDKQTVELGESFTATVDYYYTAGYSNFGTWQALNASNVSVDGQVFTTNASGQVSISLNSSGTFNLTASKGKDANGFYIPSDGLTQITVSAATTPSPSPTPTVTATATSSPTSSITATVSPTTSPTVSPTASATASPTPTPTMTYTYPFIPTDDEVADALDYLRSVQTANGSIGSFADSAWVTMAIAAAGEDPKDWDGGNGSIVDYLKNNPGMLSGEFNMGTAYARMILSAVAACEDPSDFGGTDYLSQLKALHNGNQFTDGSGATDTLNDDIWGLMALIAAGESQGSAMVNSTVTFILANQGGDGGWSWATPSNPWYWGSDVDDTAAAIMALVSAGVNSSSTAVVNALAYINSTQQDNGGFPYDASSSTSLASTAWSIDSITASGQGPTDPGWTKSGNNPVDYLLTFREPNGSYFDAGAWSPAREKNTADAMVSLLGEHYPIVPLCPTPTPTPSPTATPTASPTATASATPTPTSTPPLHYPGDPNGDGKTNVRDITQTELCILDPVTYPPSSYSGWDANDDGEGPNSADVQTVEYMILNMWPFNLVHIESPDELPYCTNFSAYVQVTMVDDFYSADYDITYNASILEVNAVTEGRVNFTPVPIEGYSFPQGDGMVRIVNNMPGTDGVTGGGWLSVVHFHVKGTACDTSDITFNASACNMSDKDAVPINATWDGDSLHVAP